MIILFWFRKTRVRMLLVYYVYDSLTGVEGSACVLPLQSCFREPLQLHRVKFYRIGEVPGWRSLTEQRKGWKLLPLVNCTLYEQEKNIAAVMSWVRQEVTTWRASSTFHFESVLSDAGLFKITTVVTWCTRGSRYLFRQLICRHV